MLESLNLEACGNQIGGIWIPKIILFRGRAGTGKSTLSNELGRVLNIPVLHKDDIYDSVAGFVQEHSIRNRICFDILYRFLENVINSRASVILDFGLNNTDHLKDFQRWIEDKGGKLSTVHCFCSDESVWSQRLALRSVSPLPNQLITDLFELKAYYKDQPLQFLERELAVDTIKPKENLIDEIKSYLEVWERYYAIEYAS